MSMCKMEKLVFYLIGTCVVIATHNKNVRQVSVTLKVLWRSKFHIYQQQYALLWLILMNGRSQLQRVRTKISALRLDTDHKIHQDARQTDYSIHKHICYYLHLFVQQCYRPSHTIIAIIYQMPNNGAGNVQTTTKSLMKSRTQLSKLTQLQGKLQT